MAKLPDFITAENELDGQEHVYIAQGGKTRKTLLQKIKEFVIGTATMGTTATDITGAIAEHTSQLNDIMKNSSDFIPLPIESGIEYEISDNYYTKNFDNSIEVFFSIKNISPGFEGNKWITFAKLPVGFLANSMKYGSCECNAMPASIRLQPTGELQVFIIGGGNAGYNNVRGYIRFYLTGGMN